MNEGDDLLSRLADVEPATLVPGRRLDSSPLAPVAVRDALVLREDLVLAMFAEGNGYVVAPLVVRAGEPIRRAEPGDGMFEQLVRRLAVGGTEGRFSFEPIGAVPEAGGERAIDVDQSNESVVVGERAVLKLYPRIDPGPQPGLDLPVHLAAVGFALDPDPVRVGDLAWRRRWTGPGGDRGGVPAGGHRRLGVVPGAGAGVAPRRRRGRRGVRTRADAGPARGRPPRRPRHAVADAPVAGTDGRPDGHRRMASPSRALAR